MLFHMAERNSPKCCLYLLREACGPENVGAISNKREEAMLTFGARYTPVAHRDSMPVAVFAILNTDRIWPVSDSHMSIPDAEAVSPD